MITVEAQSEKEKPHFSKDELCLLNILKKYKKLTTSEILQATDEFPDICHTCVSGSTVMLAGKKLIRKGYLQKIPQPNGFVWELIKEPDL